jgi:hypothetical protein
LRDESASIAISNDLAEAQEEWLEREPALRATFAAFTLKDGLEGVQSAFRMTRSQAKKGADDASTAENPTTEAGGSIEVALENEEVALENENGIGTPQTDDGDDLDHLEPTAEYWGALNPPPNIHIGMEEEFRASWVAAYSKDAEFGKIWSDPDVTAGIWKPGQRFFKNDEGLLFFRDADY